MPCANVGVATHRDLAYDRRVRGIGVLLVAGVAGFAGCLDAARPLPAADAAGADADGGGELRTRFSFRGAVFSEFPLIVGLFVNQTSDVDLTGRGPSLAPVVDDVLDDPHLELVDSESETVAEADDCDASAEACLSRTLTAGTWSVFLTPADLRTGVGAIAVDGDGRLSNLSGRAYLDITVDDSDPVLAIEIAAGGQRLLVAGRGPSLLGFGLDPVLGDPSLRIVRQSETIATNESHGPEVPALLSSTGAAPLDPSEPALLVDLELGTYSILLEGTASGHSLIEVYDLTE